MYQKALVCARFRDGKREKVGFISHEKTQGQMEQKLSIFDFGGFPFTKRFHFCFKKVNNFQSERKNEKRIIFGTENSVHVVKSCDGFIFWTFHEPLVKRLRDLPKFPHVMRFTVFLVGSLYSEYGIGIYLSMAICFKTYTNVPRYFGAFIVQWIRRASLVALPMSKTMFPRLCQNHCFTSW